MNRSRIQDAPVMAHQPHVEKVDEGLSTTSTFVRRMLSTPASHLIRLLLLNIQSELQEDPPNWIITVAELVHKSLLDLIFAPVITILGLQFRMPLSPVLCSWRIAKCSTTYVILRSKKTIVSVARNVHRWVQQSAHRTLSPTPPSGVREESRMPPNRQLSSRVERQLLDLMATEEVINLLERVSMK